MRACGVIVSYIPPPDAKGRESIFRVYKEKYGLEGDVVRWSELSEGYSGADIENVCRESVYMCLREDVFSERVGEEVVLRALREVKASVKKEELSKYVAFRDAFYSVLRVCWMYVGGAC